ncbi:MAG TPA: hypothetical protein VF229_07670 [Burkholderiaceae bacterium]
MSQAKGDESAAGVHPEWGKNPEDHFGYASDEERLAKRGMEDWELVSKIPASQRRVPYWFIAVVVIVLLIAVGLGFPFWGQRPGVVVPWFNWGFVAAIFYVAVAAAFVYFMVNLYGSERAGRLDDDPENRVDGRAAGTRRPVDGDRSDR